jgi:hypothetical protein
MNNTISEFQDLTLDFIGGQEYLVLVPKKHEVQKILPGSAILAKKVTNRSDFAPIEAIYTPSEPLCSVEDPSTPATQSNPPSSVPTLNKQPTPTEENLDSKAYKIYYEGNSFGAKNLTHFYEKMKLALERECRSYPTSSKLLLSKEDMINKFQIVGVLNTNKLRDYSVQFKSNPEDLSQYIDIFPEAKETLSQWITTS